MLLLPAAAAALDDAMRRVRQHCPLRLDRWEPPVTIGPTGAAACLLGTHEREGLSQWSSLRRINARAWNSMHGHTKWNWVMRPLPPPIANFCRARGCNACCLAASTQALASIDRKQRRPQPVRLEHQPAWPGFGTVVEPPPQGCGLCDGDDDGSSRHDRREICRRPRPPVGATSAALRSQQHNSTMRCYPKVLRAGRAGVALLCV